MAPASGRFRGSAPCDAREGALPGASPPGLGPPEGGAFALGTIGVRFASAAPIRAKQPSMEVEDTVRQAEAIVRFSEEIDRRLAEHGIAGIAGLIRSYGEIRLALGRLEAPELEWACREALDLSTRLAQLAGELQRLGNLKNALEMQH